MPTLRIRVGASLDSSVSAAFTSMEKAAKRAGDIITKQLGEASASATNKAAHAATAAAGPYRQTGLAAEQAGKKAAAAMTSMGTLAAGADAKFKALSADLKRMPADLQLVAREASKALASIEREKARATLGLGGGGSKSRYWYSNGGNFNVRKPTMRTLEMDPVHGMASFGMGALSFAGRTAMGLARAAGMETDMSRHVTNNVAEEAIAQQIVNSGYMPGQSGPNGVLQSRGDILAQTRKVSFDTATDRGEVLGGMQDFVSKTGDLDLAKSMLGDIAKLSRATGSNMGDMANMGAEVANVLGDVPDKAGTTLEIMRQIAGQGKLGAVEVRDLATQMAKIATLAPKFKGGAVANIASLGIIAQEAKQRGGAANAAQATTAVSRFVEEFSKPTVLNHLMGKKRLSFLKEDLDPYADEGRTKLKTPQELITSILSSTHGDLSKLGAVMPSSIAQKAVGGFAQIYNETSGDDKAKIKAVTDEFARLQAAQLSEEEVNRAFAASMETAEAKSKQFNTQMAAVVEETQGALLPALQELAPAIVDAMKGFANFAKGDFFQDVLSTLGLGKGSQVNGDAARFKADTEGRNFLGTMRRWEDNNLVQNAEGAADPAANMAAAGKIFTPLAQKEAAIRAEIDPLAARVAKEGEKARFRFGNDENDIVAAAKGGNTTASDYLNDKTALVGLQDTLSKLQSERENLTKILQTGAISVRIVDSPAPKITDRGTQPANASE